MLPPFIARELLFVPPSYDLSPAESISILRYAIFSSLFRDALKFMVQPAM